ncbi:MAG TPA: hypothetical protein VGF25_08405 [Thermoleophilaceae bacterium]|jgi:hypothetical protein
MAANARNTAHETYREAEALWAQAGLARTPSQEIRTGQRHAR